MNWNKMGLLDGRSNRSARRAMRIRKDESQGSGATGGGDGNNQNGNSGGQQQGNQGNNNSGQEFDAASFWKDPDKAPTPGNQGNQGQSNQDGNQDSNAQLANVIGQRISGFKAPDVMTQDVMAALGEGNLEKFNEGINKAFQQSMESVMMTNIQLIQAYGAKILDHVKGLIDNSHQTTGNMRALEEAIPSAKNPAVAPMIREIYNRALTLTQNDSTKAINMTKQMLKSMAGETAKDLDLQIAPIGGDSDFGMPGGGGGGQKTNWLEQLNQL